MPTDLMRDKEASDARYAAAKSITKKLAVLPDADRIIVLTHVATEMGCSLVPLPNSSRSASTTAPPPKAA